MAIAEPEQYTHAPEYRFFLILQRTYRPKNSELSSLC